MKIVLNSDEKKVAEVRKALAENDGYCPCLIQRSEDTKCICKTFRESRELGLCHCGLYMKTEE